MKCYLFNRRTIIRATDKTAYVRDIARHLWVERYGYYYRLTEENDGLLEVIEYDEEREEILSMARDRGTWASKGFIESIKPSKQVSDYLDRTGTTYEDLYVTNDVSRAFFLMPDLIEGAPGSEAFLKTKAKELNESSR